MICKKNDVCRTCAQNEALLSQGSSVADFRGDFDGNLLPRQTFVEEFHQCSHLALYSTSTCKVSTFWSFSMVILGVAVIEKWRLIWQTIDAKIKEGPSNTHVRKGEEIKGNEIGPCQKMHLRCACLPRIHTSQSSLLECSSPSYLGPSS